MLVPLHLQLLSQQQVGAVRIPSSSCGPAACLEPTHSVAGVRARHRAQTRTARGHACAATLSQPKITGTLLTWHSLIGSSEFRANGNAMIAQSHTIQLTLIICGERKLAAEVRTSSAQYIEPHYRICAK